MQRKGRNATKRTIRTNRALMLAAAGIAFSAAPALAASGTWTGSVDNTWQNSGNWSPSTYPGSGTGNETATFNLATPMSPSLDATALTGTVDVLHSSASTLTIGGVDGVNLPIRSGLGIKNDAGGHTVFDVPVVIGNTGSPTQIYNPSSSNTSGIVEFTKPISTSSGRPQFTVLNYFDGVVRFSGTSGSAASTTSPRLTFYTTAGHGEDKAVEINTPTFNIDYLNINSSSVANGVVKIRAINGARTLNSNSTNVATIALGAHSVDRIEFDGSQPLTITRSSGDNLVFSNNGTSPAGSGLGGAFSLIQTSPAKTDFDGALRLGGNNSSNAITELVITGSGTGDFEFGSIQEGTGTTAKSKVTVSRGADTITRFTGASSYSQGTTLTSGILEVAHGTALGTSGTISMNGGTLRFTASNTNDYSSRLKIEDGKTATFDTNGQSVTFATALTVGTSGTGALTKTGSGTLTLSAANTYTGGTTVTAGTLRVNNTTGSGTGTGAVTVNGGTLGGTGSISGAVSVASGATVSPGNSTGNLTFNNGLTLSSGSTLAIEIDSTSSYDSITVTAGNVDLGSATLSLAGVNADGTPIQQYWIVRSTGSGTLSGTFSGLSNGDPITWNGVTYHVFYNANYETLSLWGGNDVVLHVPEPGALSLLALGALGLRRRRV